jgi:ribosomal peptide maturation radical SAM protein 1
MGEEYARQVDWIDHFFIGPGLVSFPKFLAGEISDKVIAGEELDINADVPLDYDSFLDSLDPEVKPVLLFETSRGCWWATKQVCTFCGLNGPSLTYHAKSPEKALAGFEALFQYAPRCTFFSGVDTILPGNYLKEVIPSLRPPPGVKIQYEVRAQFGEEDLAKLCVAGVTALQPGIESLSTATLKLMKKGTTAFQNLRFLKACSKFPVELGWNLLIYSPGESEETYERYLRLIPLLTHLHPPQAVSLIGFVRYSEYFQRAREFGLELRPEDHYRLAFPFDEAALERVAVKFCDTNAPVEKQNDWLVRLNDAVARWRERWLGQARLCVVGDVLHDSRLGEAVQYRLDAATMAALKLLEQPRTSGEVGEALAFLVERALVFEEDGRYLSLVA